MLECLEAGSEGRRCQGDVQPSPEPRLVPSLGLVALGLSCCVQRPRNVAEETRAPAQSLDSSRCCPSCNQATVGEGQNQRGDTGSHTRCLRCQPHCMLGPVLECEERVGPAAVEGRAPHPTVGQQAACRDATLLPSLQDLRHRSQDLTQLLWHCRCPEGWAWQVRDRKNRGRREKAERTGVEGEEEGRGRGMGCKEALARPPCPPVSTRSPSSRQCPCCPVGCGRCSSR